MLPREKAGRFGLAALTDDELLALILKTGTKEKGVLELARELIEKANGFRNILSLNFEELISIRGISTAKAMEIRAIREILCRVSTPDSIEENSLECPDEVARWLRLNVAFSSQEEFVAVFVNKAGKVIRSEVLFKGDHSSAVIGVDELLRKALLNKATSMLVAHNHPSGNLTPSAADLMITERIRRAGDLLGIKLLDHLIVSEQDYFSFKNHQLL